MASQIFKLFYYINVLFPIPVNTLKSQVELKHKQRKWDKQSPRYLLPLRLQLWIYNLKQRKQTGLNSEIGKNFWEHMYNPNSTESIISTLHSTKKPLTIGSKTLLSQRRKYGGLSPRQRVNRNTKPTSRGSSKNDRTTLTNKPRRLKHAKLMDLLSDTPSKNHLEPMDKSSMWTTPKIYSCPLRTRGSTNFSSFQTHKTLKVALT